MMETREHEGLSGLAEATKVRQGGADRATADTSVEFPDLGEGMHGGRKKRARRG